jgi:hypothetical protein
MYGHCEESLAKSLLLYPCWDTIKIVHSHMYGGTFCRYDRIVEKQDLTSKIFLKLCTAILKKARSKFRFCSLVNPNT